MDGAWGILTGLTRTIHCTATTAFSFELFLYDCKGCFFFRRQKALEPMAWVKNLSPQYVYIRKCSESGVYFNDGPQHDNKFQLLTTSCPPCCN